MLARFRSLGWDTSFLPNQETLRTKSFGITAEAKKVQYPLRLLRYWFGYQLMREEFHRLGRPLEVAEIGVHTGQMLTFCQAAHKHESSGKTDFPFHPWLAVDVKVLREKLEKVGYTEFFEANLEDRAFSLPRTFDCIVCLHVLEHLHHPEHVVQRLALSLRPGGSIIGGFPVLPRFLAGTRQQHLRKVAAKFGHVSVFSPHRIRRMARQSELETEFLSGAFFARKKGGALENSEFWLRANLLWGSLFPGWPGEVYWLLRKPGK